MKILITTTYYLPNISGITVYIKILAEELVSKGHEVTILTCWHDKKTKKEEVIKGVRIIRLPVWFYLGKGPIYPSFLFKSIKEILNNQVINCHLPQPESVWIAFFAKIFGKKVYLTHHTDLSFWKGFKNKIIDSGVFVCQYFAAKLSDGVISYTNDYAKNSYYLKNFLNKVNEIYPPIKFEINDNKKLTKKINSLTKNKKYIIGFCGRVAKQKGLETLIKASLILDKKLGKDNYVFLIAGPTKVIGENYYDYLKKNYSDIIKEKFIFIGNIDRKYLSNFYKKINVLVLPSDDTLESFGWVQIESMICKTPCVATNLPGMRIPIRETKFGELFTCKNEKELAEKIVLVLNKGKIFYQTNYNKKVRLFDYKKSINQYEELFSKI